MPNRQGLRCRLSRLSLVAAAVCAVMSVMACTERQQSDAPALVITGGTLIDGTGATPVENVTVVVAGNKIVSISRERVSYPAGARTIDARGKFVLPGLIDSHTHTRNWTGPLF